MVLLWIIINGRYVLIFTFIFPESSALIEHVRYIYSISISTHNVLTFHNNVFPFYFLLLLLVFLLHLLHWFLQVLFHNSFFMLQSNQTYLDLHQQYDRIFSHPNLMVEKSPFINFCLFVQVQIQYFHHLWLMLCCSYISNIYIRIFDP